MQGSENIIILKYTMGTWRPLYILIHIWRGTYTKICDLKHKGQILLLAPEKQTKKAIAFFHCNSFFSLQIEL